jgi:hypothetical protein
MSENTGKQVVSGTREFIAGTSKNIIRQQKNICNVYNMPIKCSTIDLHSNHSGHIYWNPSCQLCQWYKV